MAARSRSAKQLTRAIAPTQSTEEEPFDPHAFADFIGQIRLQGIWLSSAKVVNKVGPVTPEHVAIGIDDSSTWKPQEWGFRALTEYRIRLTDNRKLLATVDASFAVDFASGQPMTDSIFNTFGEVNLPVNTWPYLREFLASSFGRMNWTPFTLPALKRGVPPQRSQDEAEETQ